MQKIIPGNIIEQKNVKSSSSENIYTVTLYDNCVSCTCPAGGRKTFCKHMMKIIHANLKQLKTKNKNFAEKIEKLLLLKNDKNTEKTQLKQIYEEVIYVNKAIAEKAHYNDYKTKEHPERIVKFTARVTPDEKDFLKTALANYRKYGINIVNSDVITIRLDLSMGEINTLKKKL